MGANECNTENNKRSVMSEVGKYDLLEVWYATSIGSDRQHLINSTLKLFSNSRPFESHCILRTLVTRLAVAYWQLHLSIFARTRRQLPLHSMKFQERSCLPLLRAVNHSSAPNRPAAWRHRSLRTDRSTCQSFLHGERKKKSQRWCARETTAVHNAVFRRSIRWG